MLYECEECGCYLGVGADCRSCEEARLGGPAFQAKLYLLQEQRERRIEWLESLEHPPIIGLVGCGKAKRHGTWPAAQLYTGSLFSLSRRFAIYKCDEHYVLSAKHGLIRPDKVIEAYNYSLYDLKLSQRDVWALGVSSRLQTLFPADMQIDFMILAGEGYIAPLRDAFRKKSDLAWNLVNPLDGLSLFGRMAWLRAELSKTSCDESTGCAC